MRPIAIAVAAIGLGLAAQAQAYNITSGGTPVAGEGEYSSVLFAVQTNFNSGSLPANYTGGGVVTGSVGVDWASPPDDTSAY
jgi:hypothetical protein